MSNLVASSRYTVLDPAWLSRMAVLETIDSDAVIAARMARFKAVWAEHDPPAAAQYDVEALEFDPIVVSQEASGFHETLLRDRVNQACRACTLAFATGTDLDALASNYPGGCPRQANESDDRYRRRIWLSPNTLSPHGTGEAYTFWALTADPTLRDATVTTIEGTGEITITIMTESANPTPTMTQLLNVRAYILDQARKGTTDDISVAPPAITDIDYQVVVWFYPGPDETALMTSLETALTALVEKQRWLGYDHTLLAIEGALAQTGVHSSLISSPTADMRASARELIRVNNIELNYAGRKE